MSDDPREPQDGERTSVESIRFAFATGDVEEGLRHILERITDAFVAYDRQWRFTYLNRRAERYFGRTREGLLGRNVWEEFPVMMGGVFHRELQRAVAEQAAVEFVIPALVSTDRWYGVIAYPSPDGVSVYFRDVTAQHEAERALRESEERYRSLFENSVDGVMLGSPDGAVLTASPSACRMFGLREEELIRMGRHGVADPHDPGWDHALAARARTGRFHGVLHFRRGDGTRFAAEVTSILFTDARGAQRTSTILRDLTEARRLQREIGLQETRFRRLVESSNEGIWAAGPDGETDYVNRAMAEMVGYRREEMLSLRLSDLIIDVQVRDRAAAPVDRRAQIWTRVHDGRLRRRDGTEVWVQMSTSPLVSEAGELLGTLTTVADITARKRAEEDQQFLAAAGKEIVGHLVADDKLEGLVALVVPRLADLCYVDRLEGDVVRRVAVAPANGVLAARGEDQRRLPRSTPRRPGVERVLHTGEPALVAEVTDAWLRAAMTNEDDLAVARAIGPRSLMMVPIRVHDRPAGVITFVSTRAERRYGRADLAFAQAIADWAALAIEHSRVYGQALRAAQERDEIVGIVSHDLRSPLHNVLLAAQLIGLYTSDPRVQVHVQRIRRAATWASRLIQELLDNARLEAGRLAIERRPNDAAVLVGDVIELHRSAADEKGVEVTAAVDPDLPPILADRDRMLQVLGNLIDNAIRHTPSGGRVIVSAEPEGAAVRLSVADTGPGIPPEVVSRVFERFWQAQRREGSGAGLGLSIAKGIVEAHGGAIWVESGAGGGTTFRLTCPRAGP